MTKKDTQKVNDKQPEKVAETPKEKEVSYTVIVGFTDILDNGITYAPGNKYPKHGDTKVSQKRLKQLSTTDNKYGKPFIKKK